MSTPLEATTTVSLKTSGEDVKPQPGSAAPVSVAELRVQMRAPVAASSALTMPVAPCV